MSLLQKFFAAIVMVVALAMSTIGPAMADPISNPLSVPFSLTCGGETFEVVSANEPTSTIHIIGETNTLVATEAHLVITYTDPVTNQPVIENQDVIFGPGHGGVTGLEADLITCTHVIIAEDPYVGQIIFSLTATFLMTPNN